MIIFKNILFIHYNSIQPVNNQLPILSSMTYSPASDDGNVTRVSAEVTIVEPTP